MSAGKHGKTPKTSDTIATVTAPVRSPATPRAPSARTLRKRSALERALRAEDGYRDAERGKGGRFVHGGGKLDTPATATSRIGRPLPAETSLRKGGVKLSGGGSPGVSRGTSERDQQQTHRSRCQP